MDNPQDLKKAILAVLAEKGEYGTIASLLRDSEDREDRNKLTKLIEPMSAVADILTENSKGAFMSDLEKRLDDTVEKNTAEMKRELEDAHTTLKTELEAALKTDRDQLSEDILARVAEAQSNLERAQQAYADAIVTAKADEMFSQLAEQARLTETEIQDIVDEAAMSVESQLDGIIQTYIAETGITTDQISDFREAVTRLLPQVDFSTARINWSQIVGTPDTPGGTSAVLVQRMIDNALAGFSGGSGVPPGGTTGQALIKQSNADGDADWQNVSGGHIIEDEGTPLTQRDTLNFVGTGVTVTDDSVNDKTVVTISSPTTWSVFDDTNVTVSNTTTETAVISQAIPANTLVANGQAVDFSARATYLNNSGTNRSITFRFKIGGVTVYQDNTGNLATTATIRDVTFVGRIIRMTATTAKVIVDINVSNGAQADVGVFSLAATSIRVNVPVGADGTVDWASAVTFETSIQHSAAATTVEWIQDWVQFASTGGSVAVGNPHDPVTVTDSSEIDFTLTGQNITATLRDGSIDEIRLDASVNASLDLADTAVQPAAIANFETTTQLNTRDTNNRNRANHTGTQTASTISDFQTTVSANTDVAANTAARHDAVTLAGSPNYLTIAGQVITRALINLTSHVTGKLPFANLADGTARSVLGRAGSGSGNVDNISAGNDTILSRSGSGDVAFNNASTVRTIINVADGATANDTDANLKNRANHTGTQAISTVTNLQTELDSKVDYSLVSEASSATPTATGTALRNDYVATALVANATLAAPSGTANANGVIRYRITASGGTRTIGYNAALLAGTITRTTSLAAGETLTQIYQRVGSTWVCQFESVTS